MDIRMGCAENRSTIRPSHSTPENVSKENEICASESVLEPYIYSNAIYKVKT